MNQKVAYWLSVVFHPLLMPTYLIGLLLFLAPEGLGIMVFDSTFKFYVIGFIFIYTFVLPATSIYWFKRMGLIENIELTNRRDRPVPMLVTAAIYGGLSYFLMTKNPAFSQIGIILAFMATIVFIGAVVSVFWQISAHAAGLGGVIGGVMVVSKIYGSPLLPVVLGAILIAGLVISARLRLNAHNNAQVIAGFLLGFGCAMLGLFI